MIPLLTVSFLFQLYDKIRRSEQKHRVRLSTLYSLGAHHFTIERWRGGGGRFGQWKNSPPPIDKQGRFFSSRKTVHDIELIEHDPPPPS